MKIFTATRIREIDAYTIKNEPVSSTGLMERAAQALAGWVRRQFNKNTSFVIIAGPGNNGGDAWALARILFQHGFENLRFFLFSASRLSLDSEINKQRLTDETDIRYKEIKTEKDFPFISDDEWIIDALFGTGLSRPVTGLAGELIHYLNNSSSQGIVSVDIPSGLPAESEGINETGKIIKASYTLSFQFPKLSFFFSENNKYVGSWQILPIGLHQRVIDEIETKYNYLSLSDVKDLIRKRDKFSHKGTYGHALIIAGSFGMMGAAVLAAKSAVKSGAGLITCHIPHFGYNILQTAVPEALVSLDDSDIFFTEITNPQEYTAIAVGPGLNTKTNTYNGLKNLFRKVSRPLVIDADALNIISQHSDLLEILPEYSVLTPHPKEFDRMTKSHVNASERFISQIAFSIKYKVYIVLKGAHTCISDPSGDIWFNTTGNPGMAKGGCGDILTGILVSLIAQGYHASEACKLGVYIHGLAGDIALKKEGYHALTPTDILNKLGKAFKKIEI